MTDGVLVHSDGLWRGHDELVLGGIILRDIPKSDREAIQNFEVVVAVKWYTFRPPLTDWDAELSSESSRQAYMATLDPGCHTSLFSTVEILEQSSAAKFYNARAPTESWK